MCAASVAATPLGGRLSLRPLDGVNRVRGQPLHIPRAGEVHCGGAPRRVDGRLRSDLNLVRRSPCLERGRLCLEAGIARLGGGTAPPPGGGTTSANARRVPSSHESIRRRSWPRCCRPPSGAPRRSRPPAPPPRAPRRRASTRGRRRDRRARHSDRGRAGPVALDLAIKCGHSVPLNRPEGARREGTCTRSRGRSGRPTTTDLALARGDRLQRQRLSTAPRSRASA